MYLIMEYCSGGDLAHFIRRCKRVPEAAAHGLMLQLAAGLREMSEHHLVHVSNCVAPSVCMATSKRVGALAWNCRAFRLRRGCECRTAHWRQVSKLRHIATLPRFLCRM